MAQLPPKFPSNISTITPNSWPRLPSMSSYFLSASPSSTPPASSSSWIDEFFDFSSSKRGSHRRAMSDSIAFFESAPDASHAVAAVANFDRLDDDQLMSMFSDGLQPPSSAPPSTAPSTPSDHNSISDQDRQTPPNSSGNDQSEAQSACDAADQALVAAEVRVTTSAPKTHQPIVDPKRVKRILANRQSAQRSRVRKLQYISELERSVTTLQTEVSALSPRVAFLDHQRSVLSVGNSHLKQRIAALAQDMMFKDAHQEALQIELQRLTQVYNQQNLKTMTAVSGVKSDGAAVSAGKKELNIPAGIDHDPSCEC